MRMRGFLRSGKRRLTRIPPRDHLAPRPVEDEEDTYKAIVLAGRVGAPSNEEPYLFDEEKPLSPPRVAEPSDASTLEEDTAVNIIVA